MAIFIVLLLVALLVSFLALLGWGFIEIINWVTSG